MIIEDFGTLSNGKECKLYTLQTPASIYQLQIMALLL